MTRRRRKHEEEHESHERWLVSYADFITLLFAFFVVMYSISSVNEGKYRVLSDTLGIAFTGAAGSRGSPIAVSEKEKIVKIFNAEHAAKLEVEKRNLTRIASNLKRILAPLVKDGKIRVTQSSLGVSVEINASVLFLPGEAILSEKSKNVLTALALALTEDNHKLQIEGHTDSIPIATAGFASNWDLSAVRASSVARLFQSSGISGARLTVIGNAEHKPVVENSTEEGRARNRRVTVMILPHRENDATEVALPE